MKCCIKDIANFNKNNDAFGCFVLGKDVVLFDFQIIYDTVQLYVKTTITKLGIVDPVRLLLLLVSCLIYL